MQFYFYVIKYISDVCKDNYVLVVENQYINVITFEDPDCIFVVISSAGLIGSVFQITMLLFYKVGFLIINEAYLFLLLNFAYFFYHYFSFVFYL